MSRKTIMVFCDYYLPGFKSGGGMWTVVNLVERFRDRYDFYIVARNHDGKADTRPYPDVTTGDWNAVGGAQVFYLDRSLLNIRTFTALIDHVRPDLIFLNSVFSSPSITFLRSRKKRSIFDIPVIVSPCGELARAALRLKARKKSLFLTYAKLVGLYRDVIWRGSFEADAHEIKSAIGANIEIVCAPDLPPRSILPEFDVTRKPSKRPGSVHFIFVSRLVRKKNLHYFLGLLESCTDGAIVLDIIGPIEDREYWRECEIAIKRLPGNISVNVVGALPYDDTLARMESADFFVLPTLNENFGYVFIEALASGCPLLISDRTAWNDIVEVGAGWTVPLDDPEEWRARIGQCLDMDQEEFSSKALSAREFATRWLADPGVEEATAQLLEIALRK